MTLKKLSFDEFEACAREHGLAIPIEQTEPWLAFQATIPGRTPLGAYLIEHNGEPAGLVTFVDYETHGYHYLRSQHGPMWMKESSAAEERELLDGLRTALRKTFPRAVFARLAIETLHDFVRPALSTLPYDTTVIIDITDGDEAILSRMKPRGRRDVRKALRECTLTFADETERAIKSFDEYYEVMLQTAERDGFTAAPADNYRDMLKILGPDHCRLFCGRDGDTVITWTIATISGTRATRYYGASRACDARFLATDRLIYFEACELGRMGCTEYDQMGIGSEFAPETLNLNTFKTKFAKDGVRHVVPDRDLPLKNAFYNTLVHLKGLRMKKREVAASANNQTEGQASARRDDIMLMVLGGDVSAYALCREFHEAFGSRCVCAVPAPIALIKHSSFIDVHVTEDMKAPDFERAVAEVARAHADKKIVLMANTDAIVAEVEKIASTFPENVICPLPPHDLMLRVSDKIEFAKLCDEYGLHAPVSQVVDLSGPAEIPPAEVPFPLIAKPAASSGYAHLYPQGFKKVYFITDQAELDTLWRDLRAVGFDGKFLVQQLIEGDDTYVDMITIYISSKGEATMFSSSQVLLEDHDPSLFGNPVAMITRPMPELWEKVATMLKDLGWRGFANFDLKRDPHTGTPLFMDFNPRIGRNSYYAVAGGVNPMRVLVDDLVDGHAEGVAKIDKKSLYTLAPTSLIRHYLTDPALRKEYDDLVKSGAVFNPTKYAGDSLKARLMGTLMERNYVRKFKNNYPNPTDTAF